MDGHLFVEAEAITPFLHIWILNKQTGSVVLQTKIPQQNLWWNRS